MTSDTTTTSGPAVQTSHSPPGGLIALERQARLGAGTMAILGVLLGFFVHPLLYALGLVVGAGLLFAGLTDVCGLALLMGKMPWNRRARSGR